MSDPTAARQQMVDSQLRARGISDPRVLDAMLRVPRDEFVPEPYRAQAYEDHPLPIGDGQTISQPYIVALMLESLQLTPTDKVLEVGTGSGYVTALLAELAAQVFSIERHPALAESARERYRRARLYAMSEIFTGDGTLGLPASAPFDAILVSAAASVSASRAARSTSRKRTNDYSGRIGRLAAAAIHPNGQWAARDLASRTRCDSFL